MMTDRSLSLSLSGKPRGDASGEMFVPYNIVGGAQMTKRHAYPTERTGTIQHKGNSASGNEAGTVIAGETAVRRLTPLECERLQGFPDGWTDGQADSARYRQLGNAVCVPVAEWIGRRIVGFEEGTA